MSGKSLMCWKSVRDSHLAQIWVSPGKVVPPLPWTSSMRLQALGVLQYSAQLDTFSQPHRCRTSELRFSLVVKVRDVVMIIFCCYRMRCFVRRMHECVLCVE